MSNPALFKTQDPGSVVRQQLQGYQLTNKKQKKFIKLFQRLQTQVQHYDPQQEDSGHMKKVLSGAFRGIQTALEAKHQPKEGPPGGAPVGMSPEDKLYQALHDCILSCERSMEPLIKANKQKTQVSSSHSDKQSAVTLKSCPYGGMKPGKIVQTWKQNNPLLRDMLRWTLEERNDFIRQKVEELVRASNAGTDFKRCKNDKKMKKIRSVLTEPNPSAYIGRLGSKYEKKFSQALNLAMTRHKRKELPVLKAAQLISALMQKRTNQNASQIDGLIKEVASVFVKACDTKNQCHKQRLQRILSGQLDWVSHAAETHGDLFRNLGIDLKPFKAMPK